MKRPLIAIIAASLLCSTALAKKPKEAAPAAAVREAVSINADPALWVVKDADTTIYLFGTVHMMKPQVKWLDGGVKAAYDASSELVLELEDMDPAKMAPLIGPKAIDPDGPPLSKKLSPETLAELTKVLTASGIPAAAMEPMEPWYVASVLSILPFQKQGLSPESGVDKVLASLAKQSGKKIIGLETIDQQLSYFDNLPEPQQIKFLESTLKDLPKFGAMAEQMITSWSKGDSEGLAKSMDKSMMATPELAKLLLADRNARWADWIKARLDRPGTSFVAVGAGHLAGKESVQAMLKKRKIKSTRIPS
jgi:uncharacterized protein